MSVAPPSEAEALQLLGLPLQELLSGRHQAALDAIRVRAAESTGSGAGGNKQIIKAGWVLKRKHKNGKAVGGWKRRFVVVDSDSISYFKAPGDEALGTWELLLCQARGAEGSGGKPYVELHTAEAVVSLSS